jgi:ferredoxin
MRVTVDETTCDHHGQCMIACPEVFNLVAPDRLEDVAEPDGSLRDGVEEAEAACPTLSIMIED